MSYEIANGDVLEVLRTFPDNCFDALFCDPPYGLKFMGKRWDYRVPSVEVWAECLRVLKPGAPLLSFGGSRTFHRIAVNLEDAGFELRDSLCWLYAKGFPKSLNVSKAIDKAAGAERRVIGTQTLTGNAAVSLKDKGGTYGVQVGVVPPKEVPITAAATDLAKEWEGYGTALKPNWEPILLARKPLDGTVANNVAKWGVGALNIDGCRIGEGGGTRKENPPKEASNGIYGDGINGNCGVVPATRVINRFTKSAFPFGGAAGQEYESVEVELGRWPGNVAISHTEKCKVVGKTTAKRNVSLGIPRTDHVGHTSYGTGIGYGTTSVDAQIEAFECSEDCPIRILNEIVGERPSNPYRANQATGAVLPLNYRSAGGARERNAGPSRFFFSAKVSTKEREAGCENLPRRSAGEMTEREEESIGLENPRAGAGRIGGARNHHPTLKPLALSKWLATMIKPPGKDAVLLVPFSGAGSEMIGALQAGWPNVVGIENDPEYITIAESRLKHWIGG